MPSRVSLRLNLYRADTVLSRNTSGRNAQSARAVSGGNRSRQWTEALCSTCGRKSLEALMRSALDPALALATSRGAYSDAACMSLISYDDQAHLS